MLKRLTVIVLATSIMFGPVVAAAESLNLYRQHAKVQLNAAHLKVVGAQTSKANVTRAANIEAQAFNAPGITVQILEMEYSLFVKTQEKATIQKKIKASAKK